MNKSELRLHMKALRSVQSAEDQQIKNGAIAVRLKKELPWQDIHHLHVYRSDASLGEVDTGWVEAYVRAEWPNIDLTVGDPRKDAPLPGVLYDLILVPLLAFDDQLNRLGYGGGWYDRFLADQPKAAYIGLAYETQHVSHIDAEPHDIRLSRVITDQRVYD